MQVITGHPLVRFKHLRPDNGAASSGMPQLAVKGADPRDTARIPFLENRLPSADVNFIDRA